MKGVFHFTFDTKEETLEVCLEYFIDKIAHLPSFAYPLSFFCTKEFKYWLGSYYAQVVFPNRLLKQISRAFAFQSGKAQTNQDISFLFSHL